MMLLIFTTQPTYRESADGHLECDRNLPSSRKEELKTCDCSVLCFVLCFEKREQINKQKALYGRVGSDYC